MKSVFLFFLLTISLTCLAQDQERTNQGRILLLNFTYGGHLPGGDLADRFGGNFSAGGSFDYLTSKNLILGLQADFMFGTEVKTDVLAPLRNDDGLIFDDNGSPADIRLRQRGIHLGLHVGKIFPVSKSNRRSGIRATIGGGFLQHKIRLQDDPQATVALVSGDYKKGYDRLSNGLALTQFLGYQGLSKNRRINFMAGFEFTQAFTQSRRSFNYDTRSVEKDKRLDLLFGFRIGWTLPLYIGENPDEIYY